MKIPESVKIGANTYTIKVVPAEQLEDAWGDCDFGKLVIRLSKEAVDDAVRHTLLHEVLHAINSELSEKDTEFIAVILEQVLLENPAFTKLFTKGGES